MSSSYLAGQQMRIHLERRPSKANEKGDHEDDARLLGRAGIESLKQLSRIVFGVASRGSQVVWDLLHDSRSELSWEQDSPMSSPNVWRFVVDFYMHRSKPLVFEYGLGVSTLHHIRNLL